MTGVRVTGQCDVHISVFGAPSFIVLGEGIPSSRIYKLMFLWLLIQCDVFTGLSIY
jgi:hypothetical protein